MATRVRVLWLVKGLGPGGAEQLLVGLARHLDRNDYDLQVAYVLAHKDELVAPLAEAGVPSHCLAKGRPDPAWGLRLRRLVAAERIDLVHTHSPMPAVTARAALWRRPVPMIHTEHNVWPRYHPATRALNRLTLRRNVALIAVSDAVAESMSSTIPVEVIVHGVDAARFGRDPTRVAEARRRLGLPADALVIGTVGHLTAKKDQRSLLEATAALRSRVPGLRTVIVGRGPLHAELTARADALGIAEAVHLVGLRDDVPDVLPAFDVFVLPSRYEGLPISIIEAMATSLPVVATTVGGIPEVIRDGVDGVLVAPGDVAALVEEVGRLLDDPEERARLGERAAARATLFDLRSAADRTAAVYEKVAGR